MVNFEIPRYQDNSANGIKDYVRFENGKLVYSDNLNDLTKKLNSDFATFHDDFNEFHESSQMYDFIKEFHNFLLKLANIKSSMEDQSTPKILGIIEKVSKNYWLRNSNLHRSSSEFYKL